MKANMRTWEYKPEDELPGQTKHWILKPGLFADRNPRRKYKAAGHYNQWLTPAAYSYIIEESLRQLMGIEQFGGLDERNAITHLARLLGVPRRDTFVNWRRGANMSAKYGGRLWVLWVMHYEWANNYPAYQRLLPPGVREYRFPWLSFWEINWGTGIIKTRFPTDNHKAPPTKPMRPGQRFNPGPTILTDWIIPGVFDTEEPHDRSFTNKSAAAKERALRHEAAATIFSMAAWRYGIIHESGKKEYQANILWLAHLLGHTGNAPNAYKYAHGKAGVGSKVLVRLIVLEWLHQCDTAPKLSDIEAIDYLSGTIFLKQDDVRLTVTEVMERKRREKGISPPGRRRAFIGSPPPSRNKSESKPIVEHSSKTSSKKLGQPVHGAPPPPKRR